MSNFTQEQKQEIMALIRSERTRAVSDGPDACTLKIGSALVGTWPCVAGYAHFGNSALDQAAAGNYALLQRNIGSTFINAASGQEIYFRINNANVFRTNGTSLWIDAGYGLVLEQGALTITDGSFSLGGAIFMLPDNTYNIGIGAPTPQGRPKDVFIGSDLDVGDDVYVGDNCSALSFTDRTEYFQGDALKEIKGIRADKKGKLDHESLPKFVQYKPKKKQHTKEEPTTERNLSNMVSMLTVAVQQLADKLEKLEKKLEG